MTKIYVLLAAGALALGVAASRAEEKTTAPPPADATVAPPGSVIAPPAAPGAACAAPCCGHGHGGCGHLWEWLTYCPPRAPCSCHPLHVRACDGLSWKGNLHDTCQAYWAYQKARPACGGCGDSSCCCTCTPCCTPLYMYFLDRCEPNFGYTLPIPPAVGPIPTRTPVEGPPGESLDPCCDHKGPLSNNGHP
jgi:hypothetical protein